MPIPKDFRDECQYDPSAWFIHDVVDVDPERRSLTGILYTDRIGWLVDAQRSWPGHDKHLPGAVAVQMTGTLAQLHGVYLLGIRATEGWVGFGTHIRTARFPRMGRIGPPVQAHIRCHRVREVRGTRFADFEFEFEQEGDVIYGSKQVAAWFRTAHRGPCPDEVVREVLDARETSSQETSREG